MDEIRNFVFKAEWNYYFDTMTPEEQLKLFTVIRKYATKADGYNYQEDENYKGCSSVIFAFDKIKKTIDDDQDKYKKKAGRKAILDDDDMEKIKRLIREKKTQAVIAAELGVSADTIGRTEIWKTRKTWLKQDEIPQNFCGKVNNSAEFSGVRGYQFDF